MVNHESAPKRTHRGIRRLVRLIGGWAVFDHTREVIITRGEHKLAQTRRLSNQKKKKGIPTADVRVHNKYCRYEFFYFLFLCVEFTWNLEGQSFFLMMTLFQGN